MANGKWQMSDSGGPIADGKSLLSAIRKPQPRNGVDFLLDKGIKHTLGVQVSKLLRSASYFYQQLRTKCEVFLTTFS